MRPQPPQRTSPRRTDFLSPVDLPFSEFREKFFGPLEHVVQARRDEMHGDYSYFARHPEIAQIVFEQVLQDPLEIDTMNM